METKKLYESKAVWTAAIGLGIAIAQANGIEVPAWIYTVLGSFGLYSLRAANKPIK